MLSAFPDSAMVYAPAYPALGRTVSQGHLFVHGAPVHRTSFANDMFHPVTESSIPLTIARQTAAPVVVVEHDFRKAPEPGVIHVCDGNSEHDLAQAAGWAMIFNVRLLAGPAGFLQSILIKIGWSPRPLIQWPPIRSGLIVSGSRHEASIDQIEYAKRYGFERDSWCILTLDSQTQAVGQERAMLCGLAVREYVDQNEPDALIVFGGDTAYGILKAFGLPRMKSLGEILPGVPISSFPYNGRELLLISKAGGFGQPDILMRIYELV
jgi:D-threonate/D-erythronate kinase